MKKICFLLLYFLLLIPIVSHAQFCSLCNLGEFVFRSAVIIYQGTQDSESDTDGTEVSINFPAGTLILVYSSEEDSSDTCQESGCCTYDPCTMTTTTESQTTREHFPIAGQLILEIPNTLEADQKSALETLAHDLEDLYQTTLGRGLDPSGYATYAHLLVHEGWNLAQVRQALIESPEGQTVYAYLIRTTPGSTLILPAEEYPEILTIRKAVRLEAQGGIVLIGVHQ